MNAHYSKRKAHSAKWNKEINEIYEIELNR